MSIYLSIYQSIYLSICMCIYIYPRRGRGPAVHGDGGVAADADPARAGRTSRIR